MATREQLKSAISGLFIIVHSIGQYRFWRKSKRKLQHARFSKKLRQFESKAEKTLKYNKNLLEWKEQIMYKCFWHILRQPQHISADERLNGNRLVFNVSLIQLLWYPQKHQAIVNCDNCRLQLAMRAHPTDFLNEGFIYAYPLNFSSNLHKIDR